MIHFFLIAAGILRKVPVRMMGNAYVGVQELILYAFKKVASSMSKFNLGKSRASSKISPAVAVAATPVRSSYYRDDDSGDRMSILSGSCSRVAFCHSSICYPHPL
jgi:hypothetical protein